MTRLQAEARRWLEREAEVGRLTARQGEVARRLAAGESVEGVAAALGIGPRTVAFHVGAIRARLGLPWAPPAREPAAATPRGARASFRRGHLPEEARAWLARHPELPMLGERQRRLVRLLAEGTPVAEVAAALGYAPGTLYAAIERARTRIGIWEKRNGHGR